jgi:hypothetical protein
MTDERVSRRNNMDTGEAGDRRSNGTMDVSIEMAMVATPIAVRSRGATIFETIERKGNGNHRKSSEAPATALALSDWRSLMERTMRQQAQELIQMNRTVGYLAILLEAQVAREAAKWPGMLTWI